MKQKIISNTSIIFLAILACLIWSSALAFVKIGLKYSPPFLLGGIRFILSGLLLTPFFIKDKFFFKSILDNYKIIIVVAFFQTFILYSTFFLGMTFISGAMGAIIIGSSPLISALMAHIMMQDDKFTKRKLICISTGISGIIFISLSRQPWSVQGFHELTGILLLLGGSVASAIGNITVSKNKKDINPITLNSLQMFSGGVLIFILSLIIEGKPSFDFPAVFYGALFWLSCISATGFSIWFYLLRQPAVKVSELNLWKFLIPVSGAILSWLILEEESPSLSAVIGILLVAGSVFFYNFKRQK